MKYIKSWLKQLPEPQRTHALLNLSPVLADDMVGSVFEALITGFNWNLSPQGGEYWCKIAFEN